LKAGVPENAHLTGPVYGPGWECNYGFERAGETCAPVTVPVNAYLDGFSTRRDCERGFVRAGNLCSAIRVPENGYLTNSSHGEGWACEHGVRPGQRDCSRIVLPGNACLTNIASGPGWACERGYAAKAVGGGSIKVPDFGHLN